MRHYVLLIAFTLLSLSPRIALAQCDEILKHGIFNEEMIKSDGNYRSTFNSWIYDMDFHTHDQAINAGLSVGVIVYGVPLQIGGTFDDKQKEEWKQTHQDVKDSTQSISTKYEYLLKKVSPDVVKAWSDCNARSLPFGAIAREIGPDVALVTVVWNPIPGDKGGDPIVEDSDVFGGKRNSDNRPIVFDKKRTLTENNIAIITREHGKPLVATVHTSRGDVVAFLNATVDAPQIIEFGATPATVNEGGASLLKWNVSKAEKVVISHGIGEVSSTGSVPVSPKQTTAYVLSAQSASGSTSRTAKVEVKTVPEMVTHVEFDFYSTSDDKDPEDTVNAAVEADGFEVASYTGSNGRVWSNDSGPYPCKYVRFTLLGGGEAPDWAVNQGNDASPRTFALKKPVQARGGAKGRFTVAKTGTDKGWTYRVEVYGVTNKGNRLRYDSNWSQRFDGGHQSVGWDFTW